MPAFQRSVFFLLCACVLGLDVLCAEERELNREGSQKVRATTLEAASAFLEALELHLSDPEFVSEGISPSSLSEGSKFTLQQAIESSLENNPGFLVEKLSPATSYQDVTEAKGLLDTNLLASTNFLRAVDPTTSSLGGSTITNEQFDFSVGLSQLLPTGGTVELSWNNYRIENDALYTTLSPAYDTGLGITLSQPLLKGTGWGAPSTIIRIARTGYDSSRFVFQAEVANQVKRVIDAYWTERAARGALAVALRDLKLSKRLYNETAESVEVGLLAPVASSEANAQLARSKEGLIAARKLVDDAGRALRQIMGYDFLLTEGQDSTGLSPVRASDMVKISSQTFDAEESVKTALLHRSELQAQRLQVKKADLTTRLASNQVLPDLRIVGGAGLQGLAGDAQESDFNTGPNVFPGDYSDSLDRMDSGDYYDYAVGLNFSMPLENRAARADFNRSKLDLYREKLRERQLIQTITAEVLSAINALEASMKRVEAARETIKFSKESLEIANQRLQSGLGTVRETLEAQRDLSDAELRLVRSLADYASAHAEVLRSKGDLLPYYQIEVESEV